MRLVQTAQQHASGRCCSGPACGLQPRRRLPDDSWPIKTFLSLAHPKSPCGGRNGGHHKKQQYSREHRSP